MAALLSEQILIFCPIRRLDKIARRTRLPAGQDCKYFCLEDSDMLFVLDPSVKQQDSSFFPFLPQSSRPEMTTLMKLEGFRYRTYRSLRMRRIGHQSSIEED